MTETQTFEFVATWIRETSQYDSVYFWSFVTGTEKGTFSTINISKTIAGGGGGTGAIIPIESLINKLQDNAKTGR